MPGDEEDKYFQELDSLKVKIDDHIDESQLFRLEFKDSQAKITEAMLDIARSQEKLIALNENTKANHKDIENLYSLTRDTDKRLNSHLIEDHSYKTEAPIAGNPNSATVVKASRYDKLTWMGIAAASTWFVTLAYNGLMKLIEALKSIGG